MKEIKALEEISKNAKRSLLDDMNISRSFVCVYKDAVRDGNEEINFDEVIWDYEIEQIAENLRKFDIHSFTISCTFSGLIETLAKFEELGFKMAGLTKVKARYNNWQTDERAIIPAVRLTDEK